LISIGANREITVSWRAWVLAGLYSGVVLLLAGVYGPPQEDRWVIELPHRQNMLEAARWLDANTDGEARIGSFNAGVIGYFSERTVINLDGVVNEDAYHARRDGYLVQYVCDKRIQYLADLELSHWVAASCDDDPSREFALLATIGKRLFYFGGGQVEVLQLVSGPASVRR
ncbi:MAG: hypothetical protein WD939_08730, partial [Dehalococcoidia bacterium]